MNVRSLLPTSSQPPFDLQARKERCASNVARRRARRQAAIELSCRVRVEFETGKSSDEVGEALGMLGRRVRRIAERSGLPALKPHTRRFAFTTSHRQAHLVQRLAEEAGVAPGDMIVELLELVLADGFAVAQRRLGKAGKLGRNGSR